MNKQYFLGIELFTWDEWDEIDTTMLYFYNVQFSFESMKQYNNKVILFQLEGSLEIYDDDKVLWTRFPTDIQEFKEMLLEKL